MLQTTIWVFQMYNPERCGIMNIYIYHVEIYRRKKKEFTWYKYICYGKFYIYGISIYVMLCKILSTFVYKESRYENILKRHRKKKKKIINGRCDKWYRSPSYKNWAVKIVLTTYYIYFAF